ncbi:MAG: hypothetical protein V1875_03070 [Candidatus Altiarchaeota archaeon]
MRLIIILAAIALVCGCTFLEEKSQYQYVCPGGQVVANPNDCVAPSTSTTTTESTTSTTSTTTTSTASSSSTTTSTNAAAPSTTLQCQSQDVDGYLLVTDHEDRCWRGYRFRLDNQKWDCSIPREGCHLGIIVTRPGGEVAQVTAAQGVDGRVSFGIDGFFGEVAWTRDDLSGREALFLGVIKF